MQINLDFKDFRRVARQMGIFADDQLPFAISKTLNEALLKDVRPHIAGPTWQSAFKQRNAGSGRAAFRVELSNKASLSAAVVSTDRGRAMNVGVHATGGARPKPSPMLAIPNQGGGRVRLHGRGRTPWARDITKRVPARALRVIKGRGIFVGQGGRLHAMYWFRPSARLSKRLRFGEDFARVTPPAIMRRFPANIQHAIDTAFGR